MILFAESDIGDLHLPTSPFAHFLLFGVGEGSIVDAVVVVSQVSDVAGVLLVEAHDDVGVLVVGRLEGCGIADLALV